MIKYSFVKKVKARTTESKTFEEIMAIAKGLRPKCQALREAIEAGDEDKAIAMKSSLPCVCWSRDFGDGQTIRKDTGTPTGVVMMDWDTCETEEQLTELVSKIKQLALTNDFVKDHLLAAHISPRRHGIHALWAWVDGCRSVAEVQERVARETGLTEYDPSCKDNSRKSFLVSDEYWFYIAQSMYDTSASAERQKAQEGGRADAKVISKKLKGKDLPEDSISPNSLNSLNSPNSLNSQSSYPTTYQGIAYSDIISALVYRLLPASAIDEDGNPIQGNRHLTWLKCCSYLRYICDFSPEWLHALAPQWAFASPGNDVMQTCRDAVEAKSASGMPKMLQKILADLSDSVQEGADKSESMSWSQAWRKEHPLPPLPPIMKEVVGACPPGFEDAMLMHMFSMMGALCFSKVRARYLDGELHAPNLQVIIEGGWGQGKGKFESIYFKLFRRTLEVDRIKMQIEAAYDEKVQRTGANKDKDEKVHQIVQTAGIAITAAKLIDVLVDNQEVHLYMFESEIKAVNTALRKGYGLTYEHIRKAFENGPLYSNTKSQQSKKGMPNAFINYTFTGTPVDVEKFIGKELEGGTASRISWAVIPKSGRELSSMKRIMPEAFDEFREKIEKWQRRYCYTTVEGTDQPADETEIDLGYVSEALHDWILQQWDIAEQEKNEARKDARARMAAIAFHAAIVAHMMWGCPGEKDRKVRGNVVALAKYVANYNAERFLHKFAESQNEQTRLNRRNEMKKASRYVLDYVGRTFTREEFIRAVDTMKMATSRQNVTNMLTRLTKRNLIKKVKTNVYKKVD